MGTYRAKLRISCQLGYRLGTPPSLALVDGTSMPWKKEHMRKLAQREECGLFVWSNVYYRYRYMCRHIYLTSSTTRDNIVDHAFEVLRSLNELRHMVQQNQESDNDIFNDKK